MQNYISTFIGLYWSVDLQFPFELCFYLSTFRSFSVSFPLIYILRCSRCTADRNFYTTLLFISVLLFLLSICGLTCCGLWMWLGRKRDL